MSIRRLEGGRGNCRKGSSSGLCVQDSALVELAYGIAEMLGRPLGHFDCVAQGIHE
jgi:hypothetical protein